MRKWKAFTLVELLAVIVILAIVLIIAVPGVLSIINKTKDSSYESQLKIIKEAARTYVTTNTIVWRDDQAIVNLMEMQEQGLLDRKILDPRNKTELAGISVIVTKKGHQMTYEIVYTDSSNSSYPVFGNAMIPIVYKENKWVKADPRNENQSWFDYTNQQWANVATVTEDVRRTLLDASVGTEVPMDKINTMFTWIPRFKYKLFNVDGTVGPVANSNMTGDYQVMIEMEGVRSKKSIGTQNGEWLTHPAFTFGGEELSGFWVGKFETGYDGTVVDVDTNNIVDSSKLLVKPNVSSWRYINGATIFENITAMTDNSIFGMTKEEDPHLTKNMEWGAMAYLAQSKYGRGNDSGVEISSNVASEYITGSGDYIHSSNQSTTGNISGVYDTSGGAWDLVFGVMEDATGTGVLGAMSRFDSSLLNQLAAEKKYVDTYSYATTYLDRSRGHLGDATVEIGPFVQDKSSWYDDASAFVTTEYDGSWFARGGMILSDEKAGIMAFTSSSGAASAVTGFRISLI